MAGGEHFSQKKAFGLFTFSPLGKLIGWTVKFLGEHNLAGV